MSAFPSSADLLLVLPELIWCGFGALLMLLQPFVKSRQFLTTVAVIGALGGIVGNFYAVHNPGSAFSGLVAADPFSIFFSHLVGLVAVLSFSLRRPTLIANGSPTPNSTRSSSSPLPVWASSPPRKSC